MMKYTINRDRPFITYPDIEKKSNAGSPSFPSGHTATSFAAATVLSFFDKKRTLIFFAIATLIAVSRLYLGVHFVFDIIGGATLGFAIAKIVINTNSKVRSQKSKPKP